MPVEAFTAALRRKVEATLSDRLDRSWIEFEQLGATPEELDTIKAQWRADFEAQIAEVAGTLWRARQCPQAAGAR